ncbi:MAG: chromate efflux transporter [Pseudomonadota bacterium]
MQVTSSDLFKVFGRIGLLSFGGPAAQISLMQTELVDKRGWLSDKQFLQALSFCMLLPGPEAMQLATYAGWRLRGLSGGLLAGLLFIGPGALLILALGFGYAYYGDLPLVQAAFLGIKATVVIIVFQALLRLGKRTLTGHLPRALAGIAFIAIFAFNIPFPLIIAAAAVLGCIWMSTPLDEAADVAPVLVSPASTIKTTLIWGAIWAAPVVGLWLSGSTLLFDLAIFFSTLAVVTFGGAYAVLAYMTQEIVYGFEWLSTAQMIDALGLAETTPGPLILVTEFAAFLTGYLQGGPWLGIAAALVTLWVTFTPCFLWIFVAAPYVDAISTRPRLKGALNAISACVVGVILSLAVWFTLSVLFDAPKDIWGIALADISIINAALIVVAGILLLGFRLPLLASLAFMAIIAGCVPAVL